MAKNILKMTVELQAIPEEESFRDYMEGFNKIYDLGINYCIQAEHSPLSPYFVGKAFYENNLKKFEKYGTFDATSTSISFDKINSSIGVGSIYDISFELVLDSSARPNQVLKEAHLNGISLSEIVKESE